MENYQIILLFLLSAFTLVTCKPPQAWADTSGGHGRRERQVEPPAGGIDFDDAVLDEETGQKCVIKTEEVETVAKDPILTCLHKNVEKCHYTYITQFTPSQEQVCQENYQKSCQISFIKQPVNETIRKCYRPVVRVCDGQGVQECRTVYESSCSTKYVEKQPGKYIGETACEKLPVEICGAGCVYEDAAEECHDEVITSVVEVPEEVCDINPQKICNFVTKLVPQLKPSHQCTTIPQQVCSLQFTAPRQVKKPFLTKWCLDESPVSQGQYSDELRSLDDPIETSRSVNALDNPFKRTFPILDITDDQLVKPDLFASDNRNNSVTIGALFAIDEFLEDEISDIISPFENRDTLIIPSNQLSEDEQEDLDNFNLGIQLEQFRTSIDNSFPTQDFSQFVDFEQF